MLGLKQKSNGITYFKTKGIRHGKYEEKKWRVKKLIRKLNKDGYSTIIFLVNFKLFVSAVMKYKPPEILLVFRSIV